jgi:ABC-type branched-subunit amino acid transport system ATPase component
VAWDGRTSVPPNKTGLVESPCQRYKGKRVADNKARLGLTVLMAEQNFHQAIRVADRGYVIVHGSIAFEGKSPAELGENDLVRRLYLGQ